MKDIENIISSFVESQFPEFYRDEGSRFVEFLRQYYKWLESENQAVNASRSLFNIRDIDRTKEEFLVYFKEKYFQQLPYELQADKRLLTKFATDLYNVKGSSRGIELVLRGIFNEEATIKYPGDDVFRLSNGEWIRPLYLELSVSDRTKDFVNKEIRGFNSGAKAFLEVLVRRRINSKIIDVGYLSNVRGNFQTGEIITLSSNTIIENAPTVIGSLTELNVLNGGANFQVGDVFNIVSSNGKQGKARVTEVEDRSGTITFTFESSLKNGGWGYTVNTEPTISSKVLILQNQYNTNSEITTFSRFEDVQQILANVAYSSASPNNSGFVVGATLENYNANGTVNASAIIVSTGTTNTTTGYVVVSPQVGNLAAIDTTFSLKGNTTTAVITAYVNRSVTANVVGSNTTNYSIIFNAATGVSSAEDTINFLDHPFTNNQVVLYTTPSGNTALGGLSNNTLYYVSNTTNTSFQLSANHSGAALNLTAKGTSENGHTFQTVSGYLGVANIVGVSFLATPYANITGLTTNTTATIANVSSGTDADFSIGTITDTETVLLNPDFIAGNNTGNVSYASIVLNGINSNLGYFGTDVTFNPSSDVNATDDTVAISSAGNYSANVPVLYIVNDGNTAVSPLASNTVYYIDAANATHVSLKATKTGSKLELVVGSNETGHHLIGPLLETSTGDQGNTVLYRGLGFPKYPNGHMDSVILDCLRFVSANIGSIASLTSINPGSDYNVDPFVAVVEPLTYGYHLHDYIMNLSNTVGSFVVGEQIEQDISTPTVILTVSNWNSAGSANGGSPVNYEIPEYVYQEYDGDIQASGFVREAGISSGSGTVKLANVVGTFIATSNGSTYVYSRTTASTANIESVAVSTDTSRARALIKSVPNTSVLSLKRINLENTFTTGSAIVGRTSGATANVVNIFEDENSEFIGVNANIIANAATSDGVVTEMEVFDSGFGYVEDETVTLTKTGSAFQVTAAAQLVKQGQGEGFFLSTKGFLDSDKKIHDNDYYQEFSYDIETKIPFEQYFDVLKQLAHVAGTKAFGSIISLSVIETPLTIDSEIVQVDDSSGALVQSYTGSFTSDVYTGNFTGSYSKTFTAQFTGEFTNAFTAVAYTGLFARQYSGSFTNIFTKQYSRNYTTIFSTPYVSDYTRMFSSQFGGALGTRLFIGSYSQTYQGPPFPNTFEGLTYTAQYTRNYSGEYTPGAYVTVAPFSGASISFVPFTAAYSGLYGGRELTFQITFSTVYSGSYDSTFNKSYTASWSRVFASTSVVMFNNTFTGQFQALYTGEFSKVYSSAFTAEFTTSFTHVYNKSYSGEFASQFTKIYSGRYTIAFNNTFTNNFTNVFTLVYSGVYNNQFTGVSYTRIFSGAYLPAIYSGGFSKIYTGDYAVPYTVSYTTGYSGDYSGTFTSLYQKAYTRQFSSLFSKNYSKAFTTEFTKTNTYTNSFSLENYTSDLYSRQFSVIYGSTYSGAYSGSFIGDTFSGLFGTYTGEFTSNYSGSYTGIFNGFTNQFTGGFTRTSVVSFSKNYTTSYSGEFTSGFSGIYTKLFTIGFTSLGNYSSIYTSIYSGAYSGFSPVSQQFTNTYTSDYSDVTYTNTYSGDFTDNYGNFTGIYSGHFSNQFSGDYNKTFTLSQFTTTDYTGNYRA